MKFIKAIIKHPVEFIGKVLFSILTIAVFFQVVSRYIFRSPFPWPEELARLMFVWLSLLGAAIGLKYSSHFKIDYFINFFPKKIKAILEILIDIFLLFLVIYWGWIGNKTLNTASNQLYAALRISMVWLYLAIPVSCSLMFLFLLIRIYHKIKNLLQFYKKNIKE